MLLLLGDELIRNPTIAVFELVKNAYDADSPYAKVVMQHIDNEGMGKIVVEDAGTGMDFNTVLNVWLEPGTDFRSDQRKRGERTPKYGRLPVGEKGVGRFAAHKLGREVTLVTRRGQLPEVVVEIAWGDFEKAEYLSEVPVKAVERDPEVFTGRKTGTRIEIRKLWSPWTRGMARDLHRSVMSIASPFNMVGEFKTEIVMPDKEEWLEGLMTIDEALEYSLFRAHCQLRGNQLGYEYTFVPYPAMDILEKRKCSINVESGLPIRNRKEIINLNEFQIGPVVMDLYIFDRDPKVLALGVTDKKGLSDFLDRSGGIRVYRDGIRVYDYGEPGNDWLNLGGRRVNIPTRRISENIVIGAVSLNLKQSPDLIEKTNREGFVENQAYQVFRDAVNFAVEQITAERNKDKKRIRDAYARKEPREPVIEDLSTLREVVEKRNLGKELGPYLDRIESDFLVIRDRFLTSASAGLSLTVVIHEVEKGIKELERAVREEETTPRIKELASHLADLIEGFAALARRSGITVEQASQLVKKALFNTDLRLKAHKIGVVNESSNEDFRVRCSRRLVISTLMNIFDNSIWWLHNRWGDVRGKKRIYICTTRDIPGGPAIVVADNGPGFMDPPEYLIEPFISRKPDGMGLGLHLADQVMKAQGGKLVFPTKGDISLPRGINGAVVALLFKEDQK